MLGCEVYPVFDTPSGRFEREPEPLPQHLGRLSQVVLENQCDIGFAQDPDGDRLAIVNEKGVPIGEDLTLALAVWQVLDAHEKGTVCVNVPTSKAVDHVAAKYGCQVVRTRIGEINVAESMLKHEAVVGGENIGGVMISRIHPCRDSFSGMAVILELLAMRNASVSEIVGSLPRLVIARGKRQIRAEQTPRILRQIRHLHDPAQINLLDGIFIDKGVSWVHIRRSNTESVMRVTAEAEGEAAAKALVDEYLELINKHLNVDDPLWVADAEENEQ
jgi:phosphomannomutase